MAVYTKLSESDLKVLFSTLFFTKIQNLYLPQYSPDLLGLF